MAAAFKISSVDVVPEAAQTWDNQGMSIAVFPEVPSFSGL